MASGHHKAGRLYMAEILARQNQPNAGNGAGAPGVETGNASFHYCRDSERCVEHVGSPLVGAEQNRTADLVMGVDAWGIGERRIAHWPRALCFAIIRASATVRAPSSILKRFLSAALAPRNAASPAARAVCAVSGRPTNVCSAARARHGRVARPPTVMSTRPNERAFHSCLCCLAQKQR